MNPFELPPFFDFHILSALVRPRSREDLAEHLSWHPVKFFRTLSDVLEMGLVREANGLLEVDAGVAYRTLAGLDPTAMMFIEFAPSDTAAAVRALTLLGEHSGVVEARSIRASDSRGFSVLEEMGMVRLHQGIWRGVLWPDAETGSMVIGEWTPIMFSVLETLEAAWPDAPNLYSVVWDCEDCR